MKKISGTFRRKKNALHHKRPCLMAYTLNNTQPVICTLVADQPYFYMEEEHAIDDDEIFGFDHIDSFEQEILDLRKKIEAYDSMAKAYDVQPEKRLEEFVSEAAKICSPIAMHDEIAQADRMDAVRESISYSRMGKALLDFALDKDVRILESQQEASARYDANKNSIFINASLSDSETVLLTIRELRRHWQHRHGVMINPLTFHPDHAILINRAQQADLCVSMIRLGWELQLAGHKDVWGYIENSHLSDLGRTFAREAFVDFRSLNSGKASSAAFESWFLSERCRHQDKMLIQKMLADHEGYVFSDTDASRLVSIDLMSALGEQPYGKNYLASNARMIIEDPLFTEVRDRSNANFLWFVKFERSFQETEQALQSEGLPHGADVLFSHDPHTAGRKDHDDHEVIQFKPDSQTSRLFNDAQANRANVIHIQFGKGKSA